MGDSNFDNINKTLELINESLAKINKKNIKKSAPAAPAGITGMRQELKKAQNYLDKLFITLGNLDKLFADYWADDWGDDVPTCDLVTDGIIFGSDYKVVLVSDLIEHLKNNNKRKITKEDFDKYIF